MRYTMSTFRRVDCIKSLVFYVENNCYSANSRKTKQICFQLVNRIKSYTLFVIVCLSLQLSRESYMNKLNKSACLQEAG